MKLPYQTHNRKAGVLNYEMLDDGIILEFGDHRFRYVYTAEAPGAEHVAVMKRLATAGKGLTTYINQHVREQYAARIPVGPGLERGHKDDKNAERSKLDKQNLHHT